MTDWAAYLIFRLVRLDIDAKQSMICLHKAAQTVAMGIGILLLFAKHPFKMGAEHNSVDA